MNEFLEVILRSILAVIFLMILARITGPKQISQLTFYDYVAGITIGSLAAVLCLERDVSIWLPLIAIAIFTLFTLLFALLTTKSMVMRRLITGSSITLIEDGKINNAGLLRSHFDINDMLREIRNLGYFDLSQVKYAILETNGKMSVMPYDRYRPATPEDLKLKIDESSLAANVIVDGKIMFGNLKAMQKDEAWLMEELQKQEDGNALKDIELATLDEDGELTIYEKQDKNTNRNVFQ